MIMTNSIQSTPFPPIDPWLLKMDRLMGFSSSALMTWTHNHPHCRQIFNIAYAGLLFELLGIPILLTLFNGRKALSIFYIAQLSTMIIGSLIYFFFQRWRLLQLFIALTLCMQNTIHHYAFIKYIIF